MGTNTLVIEGKNNAAEPSSRIKSTLLPITTHLRVRRNFVCISEPPCPCARAGREMGDQRRPSKGSIRIFALLFLSNLCAHLFFAFFIWMYITIFGFVWISLLRKGPQARCGTQEGLWAHRRCKIAATERRVDGGTSQCRSIKV